MEEEIDVETADFVNDKGDGDFAEPLGENEDPASDDDMEVAPRLRTESESSNLSQMSTSSKFSTLSNVSSLVAGGVFSSGVDEAEERFLFVLLVFIRIIYCILYTCYMYKTVQYNLPFSGPSFCVRKMLRSLGQKWATSMQLKTKRCVRKSF